MERTFEEMVKALRVYKSAALAIKKMGNRWLDTEMLYLIEQIRRLVPNANKDLQWASRSLRFDAFYDEISGFYGRLAELDEKGRQKSMESATEELNYQEWKAGVLNDLHAHVTSKKVNEIQEEPAVTGRGGKRKDAGRKPIGVQRMVKITLPEESWTEIESMIEKGELKSFSDYFRTRHYDFMGAPGEREED